MEISYNKETIEMKHITVIKLIILKEWWNYKFGQHEGNEYFFIQNGIVTSWINGGKQD